MNRGKKGHVYACGPGDASSTETPSTDAPYDELAMEIDPELVRQPMAEVTMMPAGGAHHIIGGNSAQWWQEYPAGQTCPLSNFPISLLPYPPFKFRRDPSRPEDIVPVDGKYLVLQLVASGNLKACGRHLCESDITALDTYMRRCNLGRLRLSTILELQKAVATSQGPMDRAAAEKDLAMWRDNARKEWRKLQRIQEQRLSRMPGHEGQQGKSGSSKKKKKNKNKDMDVKPDGKKAPGNFAGKPGGNQMLHGNLHVNQIKHHGASLAANSPADFGMVSSPYLGPRDPPSPLTQPMSSPYLGPRDPPYGSGLTKASVESSDDSPIKMDSPMKIRTSEDFDKNSKEFPVSQLTSGAWDVERWRASTLAAKSDDMLPRRVENASWRLWAQAGGVTSSHKSPEALKDAASEVLAYMDMHGNERPFHSDKKNFSISEFLDSDSSLLPIRARGPLESVPERGRTFSGLENESQSSTEVGSKELNRELAKDDGRGGIVLNEDPQLVLREWRVSTQNTEQKRLVLLDGQARSRRENQIWRLWAMARQAKQRELADGSRTPVSIPQSPAMSALGLMDGDDRGWLRTPSPEYRGGGLFNLPPEHGPPRSFHSSTSMALPDKNPDPEAASGSVWSLGQSAGGSSSHMQAPPQVVSSQLSTMGSLPEGYVCIAMHAGLLPQIQQMAYERSEAESSEGNPKPVGGKGRGGGGKGRGGGGKGSSTPGGKGGYGKSRNARGGAAQRPPGTF